jgi:hypothetical protein
MRLFMSAGFPHVVQSFPCAPSDVACDQRLCHRTRSYVDSVCTCGAFLSIGQVWHAHQHRRAGVTKCTFKHDIWSFGMFAYEFVTNQPFFASVDEAQCALTPLDYNEDFSLVQRLPSKFTVLPQPMVYLLEKVFVHESRRVASMELLLKMDTVSTKIRQMLRAVVNTSIYPSLCVLLPDTYVPHFLCFQVSSLSTQTQTPVYRDCNHTNLFDQQHGRIH